MPTSFFAAFAAYLASSAAVEIGLVVAGGFGAALIGVASAAVVGALFARHSRNDLERDSQASLSTARDPVAPWQWIYGETRVGGTVTFLATSESPFGEINGVLNMVITLAGHEVDSIVDVYANDEKLVLDGSGFVINGTFAGQWMLIFKALGSETAQPFPFLVSQNCGWTDAHRQNGRAKVYIWMRFNPDVFARGVPKFTAVVRGRKVYDPRSALTAWSDNAALCTSDWLTNKQIGLGCDYASEIDEAQLIAAANTCDEAVTLAAGGTEKRYTMNGALQAGETPRDTLGRLLTSCNGFARFIGGRWRIAPAVYTAPAITLTAADLRGPLHVTPRVSRRDLCNRVKGLYASPANLWQPTDFPPVKNALYESEDQGEVIPRELDLPFTNSTAMAQRIAKIELERVRQQISLEWPGQLSCYRLQPGDTVMVTLPRHGFSAKPFEVVTTKLSFEEADDGVIVGCDMVLRETASAVYDWNSGEETTVDPAPDTDLPDAFNVSAPGVPAITEALYETRDGRGVAAKAIIAWGAAADAFVRQYQPEFKLTADPTFTILPRTPGLTADVLDVAPGRYDFRVKALNVLGVSSAYATVSNAEIVGLAAPPATPTGVSLAAAGGVAILKLDAADELDVRRGGRVLVRHSEDTTAPIWQASFSIGEPQGYDGASTIIVLPLKPGSYLVKFEDSGGNQSAAPATISTKQASVLDYTTVSTEQEDTTFPGTHSGTVSVDGVLKLDGAGLVDDIPDIDSISSLDDYGGVGLVGTYTFSAGHNFGAVSRRRLTGIIEGITVNVNDLIDDRLADIDDWLDFDGSSGGSLADAYLEFRETDDDPTGAPTWSAWKRLDAAEVEAWGTQYRLQMSSTDPAFNLLVDTLRVRADRLT